MRVCLLTAFDCLVPAPTQPNVGPSGSALSRGNHALPSKPSRLLTRHMPVRVLRWVVFHRTNPPKYEYSVKMEADE